MPLIEKEFIDRAFVQANPEALFVFGDNLYEKGFGGQAKEMRGEPNTIGIPTKRKPSMANDAFFDDSHFAALKPMLDKKFAVIRNALTRGVDVYIPSAGVGTGQAKLQEKSPKIFGYIQAKISEFKEY